MGRKIGIDIFLVCLVVPVLLVVYGCAALKDNEDKAKVQEKAMEAKTGTKVRFETFTFDNSRFFSPRTRDVGELGDEGWVKITARGRRDYIAEIDPGRCALVIVDMQKGQYGPDSFVERVGKYNPEIPKQWNKRMKDIVIPNTNKLITFFRKKGCLIVYLQLGDSGIMSELDTEFGPKEILVTKHSAGAFATSPLDNILREFGIYTVFFTGTDTACCLTATVDEAYDRTYQTIIIDDACIANRQEMHDAAIMIWAYRAFVKSTDQVINDYPWQNWVDPELKN
jgi:nicotinamidase-related amidase